MKEFNDFLISFRDEFNKLAPEEIAYPRSVNGIKKFGSVSSIFRKGTHAHKRLSVYNHMIRQRNLLTSILSFKMVKRLSILSYDNLTHCLQCHIFCNKIPKELDIYKYIDYDSQYMKSFVEPLSFITNQIGWSIDRSFGTQTTLEDFLGEFQYMYNLEQKNYTMISKSIKI